MSTCDQDFWIARIAKTKELIANWEDALDNMAIQGALQEYRLDTGQNKQQKRQQDLDMIKATLDGLYNRLATLNARVYGCGTVQVRPGY